MASPSLSPDGVHTCYYVGSFQRLRRARAALERAQRRALLVLVLVHSVTGLLCGEGDPTLLSQCRCATVSNEWYVAQLVRVGGWGGVRVMFCVRAFSCAVLCEGSCHGVRWVVGVHVCFGAGRCRSVSSEDFLSEVLHSA